MLSDADLVARMGKLTASRMGDAIDFTKKGEPGADRKKYMMEVVCERLTNIMIPHYVTPAMQWGIDNEPLAKIAYEVATGRSYVDAGYVDHPDIENFGATPDAYVGDEGLLETKCPTTPTFIGWLTAGVVPEEHKPQMAGQILCTGRRWCDFCAYDPRMPEDKRLFIRRYHPSVEELAKYQKLAVLFLQDVDELFDRVVAAESTVE